MSVCQYRFTNGTLCGTRTSSMYCDYHTQMSERELRPKNEDAAERIERLEAENAALKAQADKLAAALEQSIYGLKTIIESCDGKFPDGSYEQGAINSMKMNLILSRAALADWRKGE